MHTYIGTQLVIATPMNRGEYVRYMGWELPGNENPEDGGYLVEHTNQPSNHANHSGLISWRTKNAFEHSHIDLGIIDDRPEYQQRVIGERAELSRKLTGLTQYLEGTQTCFKSETEKKLLQLQKESMTCYLTILDHRIDDFY